MTDRDNVSVERWYRPGEAGCPIGTGLCTVSPGILIMAGAASWKVLTWSGSGYGPWSDTRDFLVEIADPAAGVPTAVGPTGAIVSTNVPYRWTPVTGAISYRLSIRNNTGEVVYLWYTAAAAGCDAAECSVVPPVALLNGTAECKVQVWTVNGYGPWTSPVALAVNISAPPIVTLVSPGGQQGSKSPLFQWNWAANTSLYYVKGYDCGRVACGPMAHAGPGGLRRRRRVHAQWESPSRAAPARGR